MYVYGTTLVQNHLGSGEQPIYMSRQAGRLDRMRMYFVYVCGGVLGILENLCLVFMTENPDV